MPATLTHGLALLVNALEKWPDKARARAGCFHFPSPLSAEVGAANGFTGILAGGVNGIRKTRIGVGTARNLFLRDW
jgi:hypothetical protein